MEDYGQDKLVSEFNDAVLQIQRLHGIWLECKHARESGNLLGWKWKLDSAEIELWRDARRLEEKQKKLVIERLENLNEHIDDAEEDRQFRKLYNLLMKKEKFLRKVQEDSGKGSKLRMMDDDGL